MGFIVMWVFTVWSYMGGTSWMFSLMKTAPGIECPGHCQSDWILLFVCLKLSALHWQ